MSIDRHPATMVGNQQKEEEEEEEEEGRKEGTETQADVTAVIIGICELSSALASARLGWLHHGLAPPRHQPPAYGRNGAYPGSSWAAGGGHRAAR